MADASCFIGLMSGTSVDAVDAVVVAFDDERQAVRLLATHSLAPPPTLRATLLGLSESERRLSLAELGALDQAVADWFADAALAVMACAGCQATDISAIGSHGQTIWHAPDAAPAFSLQIGSGSRIAARTGCTVVSDFRSADLAIGGQGAPLVCALHAALFGDAASARAVVNIGGIANITWLPAGSATDIATVTGFDTGPGNGLMDAWIARHHQLGYDANGAWGASGQVQPSLLSRMLADPYFHRPPPKSTGREYFGLAWLDAHLAHHDRQHAAADVQATLCELTARTIVDGIQRQGTTVPSALYVCGGGARNRYLMHRLTHHLARDTELATTDVLGLSPDWVEAVAFAWLSRQHQLGRPGNAPGVTGAPEAVILGACHLPPSRAYNA